MFSFKLKDYASYYLTLALNVCIHRLYNVSETCALFFLIDQDEQLLSVMPINNCIPCIGNETSRCVYYCI